MQLFSAYGLKKFSANFLNPFIFVSFPFQFKAATDPPYEYDADGLTPIIVSLECLLLAGELDSSKGWVSQVSLYTLLGRLEWSNYGYNSLNAT